jgi:hypothetical protein
VIRVQDHGHAIHVGQRTHVLRARNATGNRGLVLLIVELLAGDELRAAMRELHHYGCLGLARRLQRGVEGVRTDTVDGRKGTLDLFAIGEQLVESGPGHDSWFEL